MGSRSRVDHIKGQILDATLAGEQRVQGLLLAGGSTVEFSAVRTLESGRLARAQMVSGVLLAPGPFKLQQNGRLFKGTLARDSVVEGKSFPAGTELILNERGRPFAIPGAPR